MYMRLRLVVGLLMGAVVSFSSCSKNGPEQKPVAPILSAAKPNAKGEIDYVARFQNASEGRAHAAQVRAAGGTVENLDIEGRIQRVKIQASKLRALTVAESAELAPNAQIRLVQPSGPEAASGSRTDGPGIDAIAESYLTNRKVTGVEALLARFPEADGRGIKVAVFDTGIDFGIEGLFKFHDGRQKLVGFYDLTNFGRVTPTQLPQDVPQAEYSVGDVTMKFAEGVKPAKVQALGAIDENQLSKDYLAPTTVDLDENQKVDKFPYAVGQNLAGKPAVWVDANRDGIWSPNEELTDFNTTYSFINMRNDTSASGARALAVTIGSPTDVQFHSGIEDHATGCSLIIGGDGYAGGRLRGMAPGVELVSFVLDAAGEDVYTLDQFMKTFLKARELGVDAISISWGFATADLASARFVADFIDKEIASAGIVVGIAAGNDGPGLGTAVPDDYIPHQGFGLGALVTEAQARNLYGWTGAKGDTVVWYSSFGPTRGGRLIPDVMSPLMTLVRHGTTTNPGTFYAFSGTSSATPAAIGTMATLQSVVKAKTGKRVDPRILKLAIQATAKAIPGIEAMRQGPGVIDVNAAYDLYVKLAAELEAAKADPQKKTAFAYELRASVQQQNQVQKAEGIRFKEFHPTAIVSLGIRPDSAALQDPLTFVDVLRISHEAKFFTAPDIVTVQATGGKLALQFDASAMTAPGTYTDVITLSRADGLPVLRVPVVVEIPAVPSITADAAVLEQKLSPFQMWRMPLKLERPSPIVFDGFVRQVGMGSGAGLAVYIRDNQGINVVENSIALTRVSQAVNFASPELPAGEYELIAFRTFRQPAVLTDIEVSAVVRTPYARIAQASRQGEKAVLAIEPVVGMAVAEARLTLSGRTVSVSLDKNTQAARPGFYGEADLGTATDAISVVLRQSDFDRTLESFLHMSVAFTDSATGNALQRGWVTVLPAGSPSKAISFVEESAKVKITAYPNLTQWERIATDRVWLDIDLKSAEDVKASFKPQQPLALEAGQLARIEIAGVKAAGWGTLELLDATGAVLEKLPIRLP
jgi:hypothetical protein